MSLNKLSLIKMKRQCQETLYNSIENELELENSQSYIPAFSSSVQLENNDFSKKLFSFSSKNILLNIKKKDEKQEFPIEQLLQGKISADLVNKQIYVQSNHYDAYKNYIVTKDIFIKSNPILDVIKYMEGKYITDLETPSIFSYKTNKKINNINNNAYIEVICAYYLSLLGDKKLTSLFPEFYGTFNGISKQYLHDISEDYEYIKDRDWFLKNENKLFNIKKNDNLSEFEDLTFGEMFKINYEEESKKDNENDTNIEIEDIDLEELDVKLETIISAPIKKESMEILDLEDNEDNSEDNEDNSEDNEDNLEDNKDNLGDNEDNLEDNEDNSEDNEDNAKDNSENSESELENDKSDSDSDSDLSLISNQSCIVSEVFSQLKSMPVQILAMELMDSTLTSLIKDNLKKEEWKSILFQICFGLAVAQKHLKFIHNDLHTDNIMFKKIEEEYKYFLYKGTYFRVPTYKKETKIIDFARGILQAGKKTYFSDVFKNDGDAGGQYNYLNSRFCCLQKSKNYNYNFDLARLGTTIINYLEDFELISFINSWTIGNNGQDFTRMNDDFSLYVEISKHARNSLPKNQILRDFFKEYQIDKNEIPENVHIYGY